MQEIKIVKKLLGDDYMDVDRFVLNLCQKIKVFKYIYTRKKFVASELEVKFEIPQSTVYRYLDGWCEKKLLKKVKNGECSEYKITPNWLNFYYGLREGVLDILLYN